MESIKLDHLTESEKMALADAICSESGGCDFLRKARKELAAINTRAELLVGQLSNGHKALDAANIEQADEHGEFSICGRVVRLRERAEIAIVALKRVSESVERHIADGFGCPFCKRTGMYVDGEYWHGSGCPFDEAVVAALRATGGGEE